MLSPRISPSMMCADIFRLEETLRAFEETGVALLHVDVMDGVFVPNYCLGTDYCKKLRARTSIGLDIHLMVTRPEEKLGFFAFGPGDTVSVHYESTPAPETALELIRNAGAEAFLAINPDTPAEAVLPFLPLLNGVLLMSVYPGFAGQPMAPGSIEKIAALRQLLDERGYGNVRIEADGCVSFVNAPRMRAAGADTFVSGTSGIFAPGDLKENINRFCGGIEGAVSE